MALIHGNDKRQTTEQNKQSKSNGYYGRHKSTGLFPVENSIRDLSLHWIDTVHITATSGTYLSQQVHHHIVSYPGRPIQHLQQQTYHEGHIRADFRCGPVQRASRLMESS